jgi:hypothetical protein
MSQKYTRIFSFRKLIPTRFFEEQTIQKTLREEHFKLVIHNQATQIISQWIN